MAARALEKEALGGLAALGASGLASAAALVLLASNRLPGLGAEHVSPLLLAIQWHLVGLTLAKFGIDYALFTIVSRHRDKTFRLRSALAFPVLPLLAAFLVPSLALFSPMQALFLGIAVFADTLSTFRQAEFNAKRAFATSAIGTLLNYPLFVVLWAAISQGQPTSLTEGLAAFAAASLARFVWFELRHAAIARGAAAVTLTVKGLIGAQGALNLFLFRSDQIALALLLFLGARALARDPMLAGYLYLARIPEFATGILVLAGTVYFPLRHLEAQPAAGSRNLRFYAIAAAVAAAGAALAMALALPLFAGEPPAVAWCVPFIVQIPLILLANLATYSLQSQSYLPGLIRNLAISGLGGALVIAAAVWLDSLLLLAWAVPAQLVLFFALALAAPWGRRIALFEDARDA